MVFLVVLCSGSLYAQTQVTFNIPSLNIQNRQEYNQEFSGGSYNSALGVGARFLIKADAGSFSSTVGQSNTIPLSLANYKIKSIASVTLLGTLTERILTTQNQEVLFSTLSLLGGNILSNLRINIADQTWIAGNYSTPTSLSLTGINVGSISNGAKTLILDIPAYVISKTELGNIQLHVNSLNFYRTGLGVSKNEILRISTTVPFVPSIRTSTSNFNFSSTYPYNTAPSLGVALVNVEITGQANAIQRSLSIVQQSLTNTNGIAVPTMNEDDVTHKYSIDLNTLKAQFKQAGVYTTGLIYALQKPTSVYPPSVVESQKNGTLEIIVDEMYEIVANHSNITFDFSSAIDYKNGKVVDRLEHLTLSRTTPYDLYVRSNSVSFSSGGQSVPLDVMRIGPMDGQAGVSTITLSQVSQRLISGADPIIDRKLNIRYTIPASETAKLLNKPSGAYAAAIVYSFVAL